MNERIAPTLLLSAVVGFSATIGALLGLVVRRRDLHFMASLLRFVAGVMISVSCVELLPNAVGHLELLYYRPTPRWA